MSKTFFLVSQIDESNITEFSYVVEARTRESSGLIYIQYLALWTAVHASTSVEYHNIIELRDHLAARLMYCANHSTICSRHIMQHINELLK